MKGWNGYNDNDDDDDDDDNVDNDNAADDDNFDIQILFEGYPDPTKGYRDPFWIISKTFLWDIRVHLGGYPDPLQDIWIFWGNIQISCGIFGFLNGYLDLLGDTWTL